MPGFMRADYWSWLALSSFERFAGPQGMVETLIPDPENQARVTSDPAKMAVISELVWSLWPPSQRMAGMDNDLAQMSDMHLSLQRVKAPVLLVHGTADANVPYSQSVAVAEMLTNATLHTIEGADHMMPFTHEQEMTNAIEAFVEGLQP